MQFLYCEISMTFFFFAMFIAALPDLESTEQ